MRKLLLILVFASVMLILMVSAFEGTGFSLDSEKYLFLDRFNRTDSSTLGNANTGVLWTETGTTLEIKCQTLNPFIWIFS